MTADPMTYGMGVLLAVVSGALAGGLTAWKLGRRDSGVQPSAFKAEPEPEDTAFADAEIGLAAVAFAEKHDMPPQGAALLSARLKLLDRLGREKGWFR